MVVARLAFAFSLISPPVDDVRVKRWQVGNVDLEGTEMLKQPCGKRFHFRLFAI